MKKIDKTLSMCCNAKTLLKTNGDADWKECTKCRESCSTKESEEYFKKYFPVHQKQK